MSEKSILPWETQLGDIGETKIKSRLQRFSTVTKIERDVGLDFYCELIVNRIPSNPFYVQAKSSQHFDSQNGRSIDKSTIQSWLTKPHPVYVIFYDEQKDICYWKLIEEERYNFIEKFFRNESKTIYVRFDKSNILQKNDDNQAFKEKLIEDTHSLLLFQGTPRFIGNGYVKKVPETPRSPGEYIRIKENARASLYSLILNHIYNKEFDGAIKYSKAVALFDSSHYNHFAWLGFLYKEINEIGKAKINFEKAIDICKRDQKWERTEIDNIISTLEKEIDNLPKK